MNHNRIFIKNVYHMLSYAFRTLNEKAYKNMLTEDFENIGDLFSEILIIAIKKQIKQGFLKDYIEITDTTSSIKGKIDINNSFNAKNLIKRQLTCIHDEFSNNCYLNQIIKTTLKVLLKSSINSLRKNELKKLLRYFTGIDSIDINLINWRIRYDRNNQNYRMIMGICYLTLNGLLQTNSDGTKRLMEFFDDQRMSMLYERFLFNYYDKEHPLIDVSSPQIKWQLDDEYDEMLPIMRTDVTLEYDDKILIIDAKFYSNNMQNYRGNNTVRSDHLYQIFAYVKNRELEVSGEVSGMLLYAQTIDEIQPNQDYMMSGNRISVKTLDLNSEFDEIRMHLDSIVIDQFQL